MRVEIHVRPGGSRTSVGGQHDGALVVRVVEPADEGRATKAALRAVADALSISHRSVTLVLGASSRRKVIDIEAKPAKVESVELAVARLRSRTDPRSK